MLLKRLALITASGLLATFLLLLVASAITNHFLGQPQYVKTLLRKSGIYSTSLPAQVALDQAATPDIRIPVNNPEIQNLLKQSYTPTAVQTNVEQGIDSIYSWLDGKTKQPSMPLNFGVSRETLAQNVRTYATERAASLPRCTTLAEVQSSTNPYTASCLPPGVSPSLVGSRAAEQASSIIGTAGDTTINTSDIKLSNGKTLTQAYNWAPTWYQRLQIAPPVLAILCTLLSALILALSGWRRGFQRLGWLFLSTGGVIAAFGWASALVTHVITTKFMPGGSNDSLQTAYATLVSSFSGDMRTAEIRLGLLLAGAGLIAVIATRFIRRPRRV